MREETEGCRPTHQGWRPRKKSDCCVTLHLSSLRRTICTSHSSSFASLAFGAFYETVSFDGFLRLHQGWFFSL